MMSLRCCLLLRLSSCCVDGNAKLMLRSRLASYQGQKLCWEGE